MPSFKPDKNPTFLSLCSWRTKPVRYSEAMIPLAGEIGLVLETRSASILTATFDVRGFEIKSMGYREFFERYYPDFSKAARDTAQTMYTGRLFCRGGISTEDLQELLKFMKTTPEVANEPGRGRVFFTDTLRTAIVSETTQDEVTYVALSEYGLRMQTVSWERFNDYYRQANFPTALAARIYQQVESFYPAARAAPFNGVLKVLMTSTHDEVLPMAKNSAAVKATNDMDIEASESAKGKKTTAKKVVAEGVKKSVKEGKDVAPKAAKAVDSAAGMFKTLIMEGKLTNDQIFKKVADKFNLDDSKKGYVKWYRNYLSKKGQNPPAAITK